MANPAHDDDADSAAGIPIHSGQYDRDSLAESLRERDSKIASLERLRTKQDDALGLVRAELGNVQIQHKEEMYWIQLEVDNLRREKEATEDRMAELYRDLREIDNMNDGQDPTEAPICIDSSYVLHLQSQLSKSMQTMGVLDNQITMVKSSCDEVVKSMKEEIADVMDDKCRMEMELMNQLAVLDNEKRELEEEYEERMIQKDETIETLRGQLAAYKSGQQSPGSESGQKTTEESVISENDEKKETGAPKKPEFSVSKEEFQDLTQKLAAVSQEKDDLELESAREKAELGEAMSRLEEVNAELEERVESLQSDLDVMKQTASAADAVEVLDAVNRDRQETLATLERVALVWEKADDSIQTLEDVMDELRPYDDEDEVDGDRERALSTLETASLVHGQIKVSLLLVELKLRNQLTSLKNDKLRMSLGNGIKNKAGESAESVIAKMGEIQTEAMASLEQVERSMSDQIRSLEGSANAETDDFKAQLMEKDETMEGLKKEVEEIRAQLAKAKADEGRLTDDTERLKSELAEAEARAAEAVNSAAEAAAMNGNAKQKGGDAETPLASRKVMERLQREILAVVERVKEKNETIGRLTAAIDEHKVREAALKRELKRMMKRVRMGEDTDTSARDYTSLTGSSRRGTRVTT